MPKFYETVNIIGSNADELTILHPLDLPKENQPHTDGRSSRKRKRLLNHKVTGPVTQIQPRPDSNTATYSTRP